MIEITRRLDTGIPPGGGPMVRRLKGDDLARHNEAAHAKWLAVPLHERRKVLRSLRRVAVFLYCRIMIDRCRMEFRFKLFALSIKSRLFVLKVRQNFYRLRMKLGF